MQFTATNTIDIRPNVTRSTVVTLLSLVEFKAKQTNKTNISVFKVSNLEKQLLLRRLPLNSVSLSMWWQEIGVYTVIV